MSPRVRFLLTLGTLTALAAVLPLGLNNYMQHVLTIGFYYVILAVSWNLLAGFTGQFSLAHHVFAGMGGYTSALLLLYAPLLVARAGLPGLHLPLWVGVLAGTLMAGAVGYLLGTVCLNMRRIYLALTTWAFAESFRLWIATEYQFTRGDLGLSTDLFFDTADPFPYYYLFLAAAVAATLVVFEIHRSPAGYFLRAIRDDEAAAQAMGVNTLRWKKIAFSASSALAGFAGGLQAHYLGLLTPTPMRFNEMAVIIIMVITGGLGKLWGPVIGALFIQVAAELLRAFAEIRMVLFALAVILIMRFYRDGLSGIIASVEARLRGRAPGRAA